MVSKQKVGLIVGSARKESINKRLALAISKEGATELDFQWIQIDDLPLFNQDLEKDLPASVQRFKKEVESLNAFIFVTPEHNHSMPALLKNAIDWGTRPFGKNSWEGKRVAIAGTSPGATGTMASQFQLRQAMLSMGVQAMARPEVYMQFQDGLIDENGTVAVEKTKSFIQRYVKSAAQFLSEK